MKKSELKNYIRENIISTLSEDTDAEITKTKELTAAIKDLESAKKEAGIEEDATPLMKDFTYDYEDIGQFYLEGFGKEHTLNNDQLRMLGKKITDNLYGGDIGKAYDAVVNPHKNPYDTKAKHINEGTWSTGTYNQIQQFLSDLKRLKDKYYDIVGSDDVFDGLDRAQMAAKEMMMNAPENRGELNEYKDEDVVKYKGEDHVITRRDGDRIYLRRKEDAVVLGKMPEFWVKSQDINENEDAEPTKSDIKKTKGLAKAKEELALLTREMKSLAREYSKAEGADKEKLVKILKDKTKLKKELENILDNKKI